MRGCEDEKRGKRLRRETELISEDFKHRRKLKFWTEL
jgi:hypothetical protein